MAICEVNGTPAEEDRLKRIVRHVILDLDGTLLDTESVVESATQEVVERYGKVWDGRGAERRLGKRVLESNAALIEDYDLPCTPEDVESQTIEILDGRWAASRPLPGASRLIRYLQMHGISTGLASSSPLESICIKLSYQKDWRNLFSAIVSGDEVPNGKPSPDVFLEAARRMNADPSDCLVIEDSPAGVESAKAAGMIVVVVPSLPKKAFRHLYSSADYILSSLLDLQPELWGLPSFNDWIADALPIEPWYLGGPVVKGYGRGSKLLGIPTANLPNEALSRSAMEHVCGIYLGWAGLSNRGVYKMVVSVGWNPYFDNAEKTVEPWLLEEFPEDFYGEELRLIVIGYIRPEANFTSLEALIEKIHKDAEIAKVALDLRPFCSYGNDPYLTTPLRGSDHGAEDTQVHQCEGAVL